MRSDGITSLHVAERAQSANASVGRQRTAQPRGSPERCERVVALAARPRLPFLLRSGLQLPRRHVQSQAVAAKPLWGSEDAHTANGPTRSLSRADLMGLAPRAQQPTHPPTTDIASSRRTSLHVRSITTPSSTCGDKATPTLSAAVPDGRRRGGCAHLVVRLSDAAR